MPSPSVHRRACSGCDREAGFSIVEMVVALTLAAGIFLSATHLLGRSLAGVLYARQNQQAADLITEVVEDLRTASYTALGMLESDLAANPAPGLAGGAGSWTYDPDGSGPLPSEAVALVATGSALSPHREVVVRNATRYTVRRYVTVPTDAAAQGAYRRLTVVLSWRRGPKIIERRTTTFLTQTRRGLPLPKLTFDGGTATKVVRPGQVLDLPARIINLGHRDRWDLSVSGIAGATWTLHHDLNEDGILDTAELTPLTDTGGSTQPNTDFIVTDDDFHVIGRTTVPSSGWSSTVKIDVTLKAVSVAQPAEASGTKTVVHNVEIQVPTASTPACTGCAYRTYHAFNGSPPGAASATPIAQMEIARVTPTLTGLPDYDGDGVVGRKVRSGGSGASEGATDKMASWYATANAGIKVADGQARVTMWVAPADFSALVGGQMRAYLMRQDSGPNTFVSVAEGTASFAPGHINLSDAVLQKKLQPLSVTIPMPAGGFTIAKNKRFGIKVMIPGGQPDLVLGYGTTIHPATLELPVVGG